MNFPPTSLVTLARLLRRDGLAFFGKCARYVFSRDAWLWLLRGGRYLDESLIDFRSSRKSSDTSSEERSRSRRVLRNYTPKISVVVTSYNYAHLISETLDALVAQTYPAHEIIVVDNGSTDGSPDIIKEYSTRFPFLRLLQHEGHVNKGLPASVKLGTEMATGEFVAFCEADDIWTPDHLGKKVELLRENWGEPNFIINDFEPFGDAGRCGHIREAMNSRLPALSGVRNRIAPARFREHNFIFTFSICMIRRSTLLDCDMLSVPRPSNLDWWLWRQVCFDNDIWVVHEKLTKWRLHGDSFLMRDDTADRPAEICDLVFKMDRLLMRKHPAIADSLRPFFRPADMTSCSGGTLSVLGSTVEQPSFSIVVSSVDDNAAVGRTLASIAKQTYGNYEIVIAVVSAENVSDQENLKRSIEESSVKNVRLVSLPSGIDGSRALEVASANAANEWIVPILAGDILRPDALQVFAAHVVFRPELNGVYAIARTTHGDARNWGSPRESAPGLAAGPFACVGAFAYRATGGGPGTPIPASRMKLPEARIIDRLFAAPPVEFSCHIILSCDDSADGRDPDAKRLAAVREEFLGTHASKRKKALLKDSDLRLVRKSRFFDRNWYRRENPDVVLAGQDAISHYVRFGSPACDRNPSPDFVGDEYLALNPDVAERGENPLVHFEETGKGEKRPISFLSLDCGDTDYGLAKRLREQHPAEFPGKISRIMSKRRGESVRVLFFVSSASMFPARPLFDAMLADPAFNPRIFVIPDMRGLVRDPAPGRAYCRRELGKRYGDEVFIEAAPDVSGVWPDVIGDFGADIVCYPSPYDLSCFRYNPHWAVGRDFLPIYVNYGVPVSLFGNEVMARQNYAYCWKVFFECGATANEYARHSILSGSNADVVGSVKMDALATAKPWPRNGNRKRVLIAPHHSISGGANDTLSLSNFQRYADYFLALPEKHPELDFVFRPHPFLFTILSNPSKWGQSKVNDWISRMKAHLNVRWSDEGDYFPVFASCDAIIQDCASFLFEWLFTSKPGCYMLKSPADMDAKFTSFGKHCLSCYCVAYDEAAIESFLHDIVEDGDDPKAAARDEFRKTIMVNYPHAADAALASIKSGLGIEG